MTKENNKDLEDKLAQLEARNSRLESDLSILASRSQLLAPDSFQSDDEIDLKELWNVIWAGKWLVVAVSFIFSVSSVVYALSLPDQYRSTVLMTPASNSSSSSLAKLAGQFGGLASLAGIDLGAGAGEDKTVIAMEVVKTWGFLETFIKEHNIEVEVFAAEGWLRSSDKLLIDPELYDTAGKKWVRDNFDPSKGQTVVPSSWELFDKFRERVSISQDKTSGLISLSVEFYSPILAKEWAQKIVVSINNHIKEQERSEALKSIEYLNEKIEETNIADMRAVFYQLVEEQTKTLMLAEVSDEYVFKIISDAKIAEEKSKPMRALLVILGLSFGGILSVLYLLIRHFRAINEKDKK